MLILLAVIVFELAVKSGASAWWTSDTHVFQALERDPGVKRRFEEASSGELQMGWDRKGSRGSKYGGVVRVGGQEENEKEKEERRREGEIKELIRNRVEVVGQEGVQDGGDVNRILSRGFGDVKR